MNSSDQLKAHLKNLSKKKSVIPQVLLQHYLLERLLERISISSYCSNIILKGGMLISSLIGLDARSTMDIDTTLCNHPLSENVVHNTFKEIASIQLDDGVSVSLTSLKQIRENAKYPGFKLSFTCVFHEIKQQLKIDITTGDIITPDAIDYKYKLMFGDRTINLKTYSLETLFAEKLETVLVRGVLNTRMKDFYDIYILHKLYSSHATLKRQREILKKAFKATAINRGSYKMWPLRQDILEQIRQESMMQNLWKQYQKSSTYSDNISWDELIDEIEIIVSMMSKIQE